MINGMRKRMWPFAMALAVAMLACSLAACSPSESTSEPAVADPSTNSVTKGELDSYDPAKEAEAVSGEAIEGSEEEQLQQERIAGGAVGGVTSENLDPIEGITDYSEGDYVNTFGALSQPPAIGHGDNGSDCLSCHEGGSGTEIPENHVSAQLTNEDCTTCHKAP